MEHSSLVRVERRHVALHVARLAARNTANPGTACRLNRHYAAPPACTRLDPPPRGHFALHVVPDSYRDAENSGTLFSKHDVNQARSFLYVEPNADLEDILYAEKALLEEDAELQQLGHILKVKQATRIVVDDLLNSNNARPLVLRHYEGVTFGSKMERKAKCSLPDSHEQQSDYSLNMLTMNGFDFPWAYGHLRLLAKGSSSDMDDRAADDGMGEHDGPAWVARTISDAATAATRCLANVTRTMVNRLEQNILP